MEATGGHVRGGGEYYGHYLVVLVTYCCISVHVPNCYRPRRTISSVLCTVGAIHSPYQQEISPHPIPRGKPSDKGVHQQRRQALLLQVSLGPEHRLGLRDQPSPNAGSTTALGHVHGPSPRSTRTRPWSTTVPGGITAFMRDLAATLSQWQVWSSSTSALILTVSS